MVVELSKAVTMKRKFAIAVFILFVVPAILFATNKHLFEPITLEHSVEIEASPEEIWDFFYNLDENYQTWHPKDHVVFKWVEGKSMEVGTTFYAEEFALGEIKKYEGSVVEAVPNRKIVFSVSFPISIMTPKFEWIIEPRDSSTVFTAVTYVNAGGFWRKLLPQTMNAIIDSGKLHMSEEGINLKRFLEEK